MVRKVSLNEKKQGVALLRGLKQLKDEEAHCDFTIKVYDQEYKVHKNVLCVRSPYFRAMLKDHTKESQVGFVEMKNLDFECVESCIEFMYTGSFDIPDDKIVDLLHVVTVMQLEDVNKAICDILCTSLSAENFYEVKNVAEQFGCHALLGTCQSYYEKNLLAISTRNGFLDEDISDVSHALKLNKLRLSDEERLLISLRWVGNDPVRKEELLQLLKLVDLRMVSATILDDLGTHPLVCGEPRLFNWISEAIKSEPRKMRNTSIITFDDDDDMKVSLRCFDPFLNQLTMISR